MLYVYIKFIYLKVLLYDGEVSGWRVELESVGCREVRHRLKSE